MSEQPPISQSPTRSDTCEEDVRESASGSQQEPSKSARIVHLFLIPLAVVVLLVTVVLVFGYVGHWGQSPRDHVEQLRNPSRVAWQSAASLAQMLREPGHAQHRRDRQLARDLAAVLEDHLEVAATDDQHVNLRIFLCRALGEFEVVDGLPALLTAAATEHDPREVPVRLAALEAIAVLVHRLGPDVAVTRPELLNTLVAAAQETSAGGRGGHERELLRERAAYALGTLGTEASLEQLAGMLNDPYPNVAFNAATGLARHGDRRAIAVLLQMLDAHNPATVAGESDDEGARNRKRTTVLVNALRACRQLVARHPQTDFPRLAEAVERLTTAQVDVAVRLEAQAVLNELKSRILANELRGVGWSDGVGE
jgi:HEAT repeat protein